MSNHKFPNEGARLLFWYLAQPDAPAKKVLAQSVGMPQSAVALVLRGERLPTLDQAVALAKHADIPEHTWTEPAALAPPPPSPAVGRPW